MKHYVLYDVANLIQAESCSDLEEAHDIAEIYKEEGYKNVRVLNEAEFNKLSEPFAKL